MSARPAKVPWVKFGALVGLSTFLALVGFMILPFFWTSHPAGYDALMDAIEKSDHATIEKLLKNGVNPNSFPNGPDNQRMEEDLAPINFAASSGRTAIVRLLLDYGANPNQKDGWSADPLTAAAEENHLDTMKLLISRGAKVDERGGCHALWRAAMDGQIEAVKLLLEKGADPNAFGAGRSLYRALQENAGSQAILNLLKRHGTR